MQFTATLVALVAFTSSVVAQTANFDPILSPTQDQQIPAGSSFDIVWQESGADTTATVSILLLQGVSPSTLEVGATVAAGIPNSQKKYTWAVPATSNFATYGFKIVLDSAPTTFQYSFPFHISGAASSSSSASSTAVSSSASGSVTASSSAPATTAKVTALDITSTINSTVTSTVCTKCAGHHNTSSAAVPTTFATFLNSTGSAAPTGSVPYSNSTATSVTVLTPTAPSTTAGGAGGNAATSAPATATKSGAGMTQVATGGFALVAVLMAFAL